MASIALKGLTKSFNAGDDAPAAVADLDLDIKDNEFVTLLGPSGCGKTTTLRMIAGYIVPDAGTIHVGSRLISSPGSVTPPDQRGMGMVFQNYAVWPHKTVYENVVFGLKIRKTPAAQARKKVEETLALVNLTGLAARYPNELSGGQQQRVALARSLVVEPEILLLDEPLSNLDAKLREQMRVELKRLQRRTGITFVYVTHDQAEALALSDHIAVIHGGRLQQYGTPFEVYSRPANRLVADFMGLVNLVPGKVLDIRDGIGRIAAADLQFDIAIPSGLAAGDRIEVAIRPENIRLHPLPIPPLPPPYPPRQNGGGIGKGQAGEGSEGDKPADNGAALAQVSDRTFLGNVSEYYATLASGQVLRVQTHPLQMFAVGDTVAIEIDTAQCSVFRQTGVPQ